MIIPWLAKNSIALRRSDSEICSLAYQMKMFLTQSGIADSVVVVVVVCCWGSGSGVGSGSGSGVGSGSGSGVGGVVVVVAVCLSARILGSLLSQYAIQSAWKKKVFVPWSDPIVTDTVYRVGLCILAL